MPATNYLTITAGGGPVTGTTLIDDDFLNATGNPSAVIGAKTLSADRINEGIRGARCVDAARGTESGYMTMISGKAYQVHYTVIGDDNDRQIVIRNLVKGMYGYLYVQAEDAGTYKLVLPTDWTNYCNTSLDIDLPTNGFAAIRWFCFDDDKIYWKVLGN